MDITTILDSKIVIAATSVIIGIMGTVIIQYWLNKRGLFTYCVSHNHVGMSAEDAIYGSIKMTWNNNPVHRLYLSTIELTNQSMKDFDSVKVCIYTTDTRLLSQRTGIVGTPNWIDFTEEYKQQMAVPEGGEPTLVQWDIHHGRREYFVPTINRGQKLRFEFLNMSNPEKEPTIWLDVQHKGVLCKYQIEKNQFLGVPQDNAAIAGALIGLVAVGLIVIYLDNLPWVAFLSFFIGSLVLIPGAYVIKTYRKIRDWMAG